MKGGRNIEKGLPDRPTRYKERREQGLLQIVSDDLDRLRQISEAERPTLDDLREASVRLHKLVIDNSGNYFRVWRELNIAGRPCVVGRDLDRFLGDIPHSEVNYASLGPLWPSRHGIRGPLVARPPSDVERHLRPKPNYPPVLEDIPLATWLKKPCVFADGEYFSPADVIKFIRHKRGGGHIDQKPLNARLARLAPYCDPNWGHQSISEYLEHPPLFRELHGIAQAITNSGDSIDRLTRELARVLNTRPFGRKERAQLVDGDTVEHLGWVGGGHEDEPA
jgi:hypothetical protein